MAADEMPQSRRRHSRVIAALILAVGVVAGAFALRRFLISRPRPELALGSVSRSSPAPSAPPAAPARPEAAYRPAVDDVSASTASGSGDVVAPDREALALDREAVESDYEEWTVATLRTHARELGITGCSRMRKAELVEALRGAAG